MTSKPGSNVAGMSTTILPIPRPITLWITSWMTTGNMPTQERPWVRTSIVSRFVLLFFKDDNDADGFLSDDFAQRVFNGKPVGLYQVAPTKSCECRESKGQSTRGWGNHARYGWWIHKSCGRPGTLYRKSYGRRLFGALGNNLFPVDKTPNIMRNPRDMVS